MEKGICVSLEVIKETLKNQDFNRNLKERRTKEELESVMKEMFAEKKILDGDEIEKIFFPSEKYDIFISYSHDDQEYVKQFAYYLEQKGLSVFIDCEIWGSADFLLRLIDNEYCRNENGYNYNYIKRNFSTSHIHSILHSALGTVINKSKVAIFIDSDNSLNSTNKLSAKIKSPWIYQELKYYNLIIENKVRLIGESTIDFNGLESKYLTIERTGDKKYLLEITHKNELNKFIEQLK